MTIGDTARATTRWLVERWDGDQTAWLRRRSGLAAPVGDDFARHKVRPFEVTEVHGNLVTTAGLGRQASLIIGAGGQAMTNTATRIGVGNGAGTAAVGDTDLSAAAGAANRWFQVMDATYPQQAAGVITLKATFGGSDGNFNWTEFGIDIGAPTVASGATVGALLYNHRTAIAQGTKANLQIWAATATITYS
ncbi:hypothetical protein [Sphaerisporangium sp. NPDC051011]|uniref:hypothetical protein n=1 Tax=Sphaerisporangium sp. NPDC051011 TaxID=3155792 RepID=UPI0033CE9C40